MSIFCSFCFLVILDYLFSFLSLFLFQNAANTCEVAVGQSSSQCINRHLSMHAIVKQVYRIQRVFHRFFPYIAIFFIFAFLFPSLSFSYFFQMLFFLPLSSSFPSLYSFSSLFFVSYSFLRFPHVLLFSSSSLFFSSFFLIFPSSLLLVSSILIPLPFVHLSPRPLPGADSASSHLIPSTPPHRELYFLSFLALFGKSLSCKRRASFGSSASILII